MIKFKFTEKHLSLVIGIPILIIAFTYFCLLVKYVMNESQFPKFFESSTLSFYQEFTNILTGILQWGISITIIVFVFIWFSKVFKW